MLPPTAPHPDDAPSRGLFLALEGGDGAGKSTQGRLLRDWFRERGREVVMTHEPGGSALGTQIRQLLLHGDHVAPRAEALLFAADRAHHVETVIRPALHQGDVVITDRYLDSSVAYQGAGRDLDADEVRSLSLWAVQGLVPDLTIVLDISPELGRARRGAVHDRLEAEPDGFHARVRARFLALAAATPERYLVVDATEDPDQIHDQVVARLETLVGVTP